MAIVRPVSKTGWYLEKRSYFLHMLHELTSLFIGVYALILLWGIGAVAGGPEAYQAFLNAMTHPITTLFLWAAAIAFFYHSVVWFSLTPQAMPIQRGEEFVPGSIIAGGHFLAWAVLTVAVLFLAGVF